MKPHVFLRNTFLLLWLGLSASTLFEHQVDDFLQHRQPLIQDRQSANGFVATTGVTDTGVQPRLEIRDLEKNTDMLNIFLLGLQRFMQTNQSEKLSYYQIAGIHGRPYTPWDNVPAVPGAGSPGYCPHVSNLFMTWHRAYLLLVEQTLFSHIIEVVNEFPAGQQRQKYAAVAMQCRMPYWDWAAPPADGQNYPSILQQPTVNVTLPNGTATMANPLFSYQFHPVSETDFFFNPYASWPQTLRNPTNLTQTAVSNNPALGPILNNARNGMMNRLYNLFAYYGNYTQFGNEAWEANVQNADSLEALHGVIHNIVGVQGHMTYFDYSAFDPVFWLHHVMIDRCFALWQAVNPDSKMENRTAIAQSFTVRIGDPEDPETPLDPFHKSPDGTKFTSNDLWDHTQYGYTYPELTNASTPASVRATINALYGSNAAAGGIIGRTLAPRSKAAYDPASAADLAAAAKGALINGRYRNYLANIVSQKFGLNGSYAVYVFLGEAGADAALWPLSRNLVGTHAVFAAMQGEERHAAVKISGSVPLTDALLHRVVEGRLESMEGEAVGGYLRGELEWRVAMLDGTPVDAADVPDLSVAVVSAEVQPAASEDEFPTWGYFSELKQATKGRVGGYS